jgi:hypothetical protein
MVNKRRSAGPQRMAVISRHPVTSDHRYDGRTAAPRPSSVLINHALLVAEVRRRPVVCSRRTTPTRLLFTRSDADPSFLHRR